MQRKWKRQWQRILTSVLAPTVLATTIAFSVSSAGLANPNGGTIIGGSGSITNNGTTTTINQASDKLSINWQSFNIAKGETVTFLQPGVNSIALNRVVGNSGSAIYGALNANGKVFLINTNGILFAPGAQVNVGGLLASTLNLSDDNFFKGKYDFYNTGKGASVINQGSLVAADGGYVALLGANAINEGIVVANRGSAVLAAGTAATLDFTGDGLINLSISQAAMEAQVVNSNLIQADGGLVIMTGRAAGSLTGTVVNNTGIIKAQSLTERNGKIMLSGGTNGITQSTGTLDVSSVNGTGGSIEVTGNSVRIGDGSRLLAGGATGGGQVLIGGGWQGGGDVQHAKTAVVDATAIIDASATEKGKGGTVVVWSDDYTRFAGAITAKGGANGGDGGKVETSGKQTLKVADTASVNTLAAKGKAGNWLLDPADFTIAASEGDITGAVLSSNLGSGNITILSGDGTINVNGNGDIHVNDEVSWSANTMLTLTAVHDININAPITVNGSGAGLSLNYGGDYSIRTKASYSGTVLDTNGKPVAKPDTSGGVYGSVTFTNSGNTNGLNINGDNYTLLHSMSQLDGLDGYDAVNASGTVTATNGKYALAKDLNAAGATYSAALLGLGYFNSSNYDFAGTFDGLGHTIAGLIIESSNRYVGLIGSANSSAQIRNVGLVGGSVLGFKAAGSVGTTWVGGLVGNNYGAIRNVYNSGSVTGRNASPTVGGLVGRNMGTIDSSYNEGSVLAESSDAYSSIFVGGVAGENGPNGSNAKITNSHNHGSVTERGGISAQTGGLTGTNWSGGIISNVYNSGAVAGIAATIGGLTGTNQSGSSIRYAFNSGSVQGEASDIGGLVGNNFGNISDAYNSETGTVMAIGTVNLSGSVKWNYTGGLVGLNQSPGMLDRVYNAGSVSGEIDGVTGSGSYYMYTGGVAGMSSGSISNAYNTGNVSNNKGAERNYVGGLLGYSSGSIQNSYNTGAVTSTITGHDTAGQYNYNFAGGLVGYGYGGSIKKSYNTGRVTAAITGSSTAVKNHAGGLIGKNNGSAVENTYNQGHVFAVGSAAENYTGGLVAYNNGNGSITNSYSSGLVSGNTYSGGFVGYLENGTVSGSYWDIGTSGQTAGIGYGSSSGVTGKNTGYLMDNPGNYGSWDFSSIWGMINGVTYPYFTWNYATPPQVISGTVHDYAYTPESVVPTVTLAVNGVVIKSIESGASGFYYFLLPNNTVSSGDEVRTYSNYGSSSPAIRLANGTNVSLTGLDLNVSNVQQNEQVETAIKHSQTKNTPVPSSSISQTGVGSNTVPVNIIQGGINLGGMIPGAGSDVPQVSPSTQATVQLSMPNGQSSGYNVSMAGQSLTLTLTGTPASDGGGTGGAGALAVLTVREGQGTQTIGHYSVLSGSSGLTLSPTTITEQTLPPEPGGEAAAMTTFRLNETGGVTAEFRVLYADTAISIQPTNEAAAAMLQAGGNIGKLVVATGILSAQQHLGAGVQSITAVYLR